MPRFTLRNQSKIETHFNLSKDDGSGKEVLTRINKSLTEYFLNVKNIEDDIKDGEGKFKLLIINDVDHTCGVIVFHIIGVKFDVYRLAFSEIIN